MVKTHMSYELTSIGISDKGLLRQNNEDVWGELPLKQCYIIADGMGGHQAGEVASHLAVETILNTVKGNWDGSQLSLKAAENFLLQVIQKANQKVYLEGNTNSEWYGMGTTLCCLLFHVDGVAYAHVGDSRIYLLRKKKLKQLTQDHSLLKERTNHGLPSEPLLYKHVLTKAVGTEPLIVASCGSTSVEPGDLFFMCTDGVTDLISNEEIEKILNQIAFDKMPSYFVSLAKERGAHDNITLVAIRVHETHLS